MSVANLLSLKYRDAQGVETTLSYPVKSTYASGDTELTAFIQALQDMSNAEIVEAKLLVPVVVTGLTGSQPTAAEFQIVSDHALLQFDRSDLSGKTRITIPAPKVTIFDDSGPYLQADIDLTDSLVVALVAAAITEPVLATPQDGTVILDKGWRRGVAHS